MINPDNVTCFTRTRAQLEEFVLFATMVPTKPAHRMAQLLDRMLRNGRLHHSPDMTPFELVRAWSGNGTLEDVLRSYRIGQYTRLSRCWRELTAIRLARPHVNDASDIVCTRGVDLSSVAELEKVHGIGPKTARFIVLHSVRGARCIPVDTHWVKELREKGYPVRIDGAGLDARTHAEYERYALMEVAKSGMTAASYDLYVWTKWNRLALAGRAA